MEDKIVVIDKNELRAGTFILSKGFEVEHRALRRLVIKYKAEFEEFGFVTTALQQIKKKRGRQVDEFFLNEAQSMYLGTLLTNNEAVRIFKRKLVVQFDKMKKELVRISSQAQNAQWLEQRKAGKETRGLATDTIKDFVEYAKDQGSSQAERYYANITKMENQALFLLEQKYPNLRNALDIHQLSTVKSADQIVIKSLQDGMKAGTNYRDIYKLAKLRVESFAEIIGRTLIPSSQLPVA